MAVVFRRLARVAVVAVLLVAASVVGKVTGLVPHAYAACYGNHIAAADYTVSPKVELWYNDCSHWMYVKMWVPNYAGYTEEALLEAPGPTVVDGPSQNNGDPTFTYGITAQCGHTYFGAADFLMNGQAYPNKTTNFTPSC
jgi:hypothetical protein